MVRTQFQSSEQSIGHPNSFLSFLRHFNIYLSRNSSRKQHWKKCFHHGNKQQVKKHQKEAMLSSNPQSEENLLKRSSSEAAFIFLPFSLARVRLGNAIDEKQNSRIALDSKLLRKLCVYRGIDLSKRHISLENRGRRRPLGSQRYTMPAPGSIKLHQNVRIRGHELREVRISKDEDILIIHEDAFRNTTAAVVSAAATTTTAAAVDFIRDTFSDHKKTC